MAKGPKLQVKMPESVLTGVYANQLAVRHTREEFVLDFINRFPPRGIVAARVIVSPGHLKRMIGALQSTLGHFEKLHGEVRPSVDPLRGASSAGSQIAQPAPGAAAGDAAPPTASSDASPADPGSKTGKSRDVKMAIPDAVLAGVYANQMMISHTGEEFLLDFVNMFPPQGIVTARVFISPEQVKRMIAALKQNFVRYESAHGTIPAATVPRPDSTYLN